jgi:hypothetical protein
MSVTSKGRFVSLFLILINIVWHVPSAGRAVSADDLDNIILEGSVRDTQGAVIIGAALKATAGSTGLERSVVSDSQGRFRIVLFDPGEYSLTASAKGFTEERREFVQISAGTRISTDFYLAPGGVNAQVFVEAGDAEKIDVTRTVAGSTFDRRAIDELPLLNRDPLGLAFLLGGVTEAPLSTEDLAEEGSGQFFRGTPEEAGLFSLTGGQATSNNLTIDGLDNNDDRAARERVTLPPEAVSEVQVITNQYAAEYGRASGGRINLRTKGGSNGYHAGGYFYFADEALNANTFYRNARGLGRVPQQRRRAGATVSGPIKRDRDFFFGCYERFDVTDFVTIDALVPTRQNPLFPLPSPNRPVAPLSLVSPFIAEISTPETRNLISGRTDLALSDSHNATIRLDVVRQENKRGFPGGTRLADTILLSGRNTDSISITDNLILSAKLVSQSRFQLSRLLPRNSPAASGASVIIREPSPLTTGGFTGSSSSPAFSREERRWQIQDSITFSSGSHLFKFGGDVQLVRSSFTDLFATGGVFTFDDPESFLANNPSRFQQRFNTQSRAANDVIGVFAQDEWRIRPALTLSLGMRWDDESILGDRDNFSPRLSIAWDPFAGRFARSGDGFFSPGKTVVRAGFGLFYNRALLRTIDDFSLGKTSILLDSDITPELLARVRFPSLVADSEVISEFGIMETQFLRRVSANLEIPYTLQAGLGIERELTKHLIATADYIFTRGAHLWRESNVNAPVVPPGFSDLTEYLLSRDFDNRPLSTGKRPISGASADVVRFDLGANTSTSAGAIRIVNGLRVLTLGLNAARSSNLTAALNAVRPLRPDPSLTQVELLESSGNSFYHGGIFSIRYALKPHMQFRAVYTVSKFIDEGTTNTASPQDLLDRRAERALSLQDQRHRFVFSGSFQVPGVNLDLAPVISLGSSKPFNIGAGFDRNLNDIPNDRPDFLQPLGRPLWRRPGSQASDLREALRVAPIGSSGNLPRNYGRGPGTKSINLRIARSFTVQEGLKIRLACDAFNVFNNTVFSFGSEFIDRDDAGFLIPQRTQRPRSIQLSLKISL